MARESHFLRTQIGHPCEQGTRYRIRGLALPQERVDPLTHRILFAGEPHPLALKALHHLSELPRLFVAQTETIPHDLTESGPDPLLELRPSVSPPPGHPSLRRKRARREKRHQRSHDERARRAGSDAGVHVPVLHWPISLSSSSSAWSDSPFRTGPPATSPSFASHTSLWAGSAT